MNETLNQLEQIKILKEILETLKRIEQNQIIQTIKYVPEFQNPLDPTIIVCTCPSMWFGTVPPHCPEHNP